jgi:hypothetical protein
MSTKSKPVEPHLMLVVGRKSIRAYVPTFRGERYNRIDRRKARVYLILFCETDNAVADAKLEAVR